ncbi:MAG: SelB C-terminal domain-containing protein, partial [Lentisphaeraceae bacterium]|nr:SelB C-terminal domain-containing protein [Lentisphaeraceae bacterium]
IGGGTILDPDPLHHRRRHQIAIERLAEVQKAGLKGLINIKIAESDFVISSKNLAFRINTPEKEIMAVSEQGLSRTDVYSSKDDHFFISRPALKELKKLILKEVDDFHTVNFLSVDGITVEEITPKLSNFGNDLNEVFIKIILENLVKEGSLRKSGKGWSLSSHKTSDNEDLYKKIEIVKKWYTDLGFTVYSQGKLLEEVEPLGIDEALLGKIIPYLVKTDWLTRFEDSYTRTTILEQTKNILLTYLIDGEPLTVAAFRDLLEGNRKLCLMAFGLFEKEGLVVRVGDTRELTQKGLQTAKEIKHSQENA